MFKNTKIIEFFICASPCSIKVWLLIQFYDKLCILFWVLTYFFNWANTNSIWTKQELYGYITWFFWVCFILILISLFLRIEKLSSINTTRKADCAGAFWLENEPAQKILNRDIRGCASSKKWTRKHQHNQPFQYIMVVFH